MLLAKDGSLSDDSWRHLGEDEAIPTEGSVTVSLARWRNAEPALRERMAPLGLRLPNTVAPREIASDLARFALIVLSFPKFTDGRGYSQARVLRTQLGYGGELRADGEVLRDQLLFMKRCGFDTFVVGERAIREEWATAFGEFDVFYQQTPDGRPSVMRERLSPHAP